MSCRSQGSVLAGCADAIGSNCNNPDSPGRHDSGGSSVRLLDELLNLMGLDRVRIGVYTVVVSATDPSSVLCKVLLFAMIRRIRSSRLIEYEVTHSIDFIWLTSAAELTTRR